MDQNIGKLLDNRYELLELIGVGGMAKVYKARCHRLNRLVAVKILRDDLSQESDFRRRFYDESQAVAMLSHPNIVAVYDVSRSDDLEYIVMELIDGITLKQYMQKKGNKLNWREALHFITQIVKGLGHAHSRGIIHRDIKPHNVMVLRDGSVKVADFGIARLASAGHSTLTQETLGSVHYISPEQARGSHIDARSDLYSAGVVLYEMLTGRLPFEGDSPVSVAIQHINSIPLSPRELNEEIPEALERITMKAMAPNVDKRYENAAAMLADLEEFRKNPSINFDYTQEDLAPLPLVEEKPEAFVEKTVKVSVDSLVGAGRVPRGTTERRGDEERERRRRARQDEENYEEPKTAVWPIFTAVGVILVLMVGVFVLLYNSLFAPMMRPTPDYVIPDLLGKLYADVKGDKDLIGDFVIEIENHEASDKPAGTILRQTPNGGTVTKNQTAPIKITVASEQKAFKMQDVKGLEYHRARTLLQGNGLLIQETVFAPHDEIPNGHVIETSPPADTDVQAGYPVRITVSTGPEEKFERVPALVGKTEEEARGSLEPLNLNVGTITPVWDDNAAVGVVVWQSVPVGTEVKQGTAINLNVSQGPDPATQTNPELTKPFEVELPDGTGPVKVTLKEGNVVVGEQMANPADTKSVTFSITGSGTRQYSIYFNDQFYQSRNVDFNR